MSVPAAPIRYLILTVLIAAWNSPAQAGSSGATHRACDPYRQFDRQCRCAGADHYFLGYGEKYCERFMQATGWSPVGARWRDRTLACLTRELRLHFSMAPQGCDCATIKAFAFHSHPRCYRQKPLSACKLPLSDLYMIFRTLDMADLLDPGSSGQALGVTLSCLWENGNAEARPDLSTR